MKSSSTSNLGQSLALGIMLVATSVAVIILMGIASGQF